MNLNELAASLNVLERTDLSEFQRRARVLQSMWRQEQGITCGEHRGRSLGSRMPMPWAQDTLSNFLTDSIREVVRSEVCDPVTAADKLYGKPRIFNDLLSSQPLCFNLFGELTQNRSLISAAVTELTSGRFTEVTSIIFEHSPGRRDPRYLNDRSAFDVFLLCRTSAGGKGFLGIEVKYHESLVGPAGEHKSRYDEVADLMGCFVHDRERLRAAPIQQIWRDHLLAGITKIGDGYDDGMFVMLYPKGNPHVSSALKEYRKQLSNTDSFAAWTMEDFIGILRLRSDAPWIHAFCGRYLAFDKIERRLGAG